MLWAHLDASADAVVLRSALDLQRTLQGGEDRLVLWTSDKRLVRSAQAEGLPVFDPEVEAMDHLRELLAEEE